MALNIQILPVTPFRQNCALMWDSDSKEAVLIDVGGEVEGLLAEIAKHQLTLTAVWLTHGHLDHAAGVPMLLTQYDVPVLGPHRADQFLLDDLPQTTQSYGFPLCPAFVPSRYLQEDDVLTLGQYTFDVLHIPGHTPGHIVFYCAQADVLIAGDVLFYESIGRTDFPRGDHQALLYNIQTKLYALPEQTQVLPGHGHSTTIGHEKKYNPFVQENTSLLS